MPTRSVITLPYQFARTPLAIFDIKVMHRLAEDSPHRLAFDRAVASLDFAAGRLLHDDGLKQQGSERMDRAGRLARAVDLEQEAAAKRSSARQIVRTAEQEAAAKREQARERATEGLQEAAKTETQGKQAAARKARTQAAKGKQQAETRANQKLSTIQQSLERTEAITEAREHQAEEKAKVKLAEVSQEQAEARDQREQADKLDDLVAAKKAQRQDS